MPDRKQAQIAGGMSELLRGEHRKKAVRLIRKLHSRFYWHDADAWAGTSRYELPNAYFQCCFPVVQPGSFRAAQTAASLLQGLGVNAVRFISDPILWDTDNRSNGYQYERIYMVRCDKFSFRDKLGIVDHDYANYVRNPLGR